jgi:hypothetical protein
MLFTFLPSGPFASGIASGASPRREKRLPPLFFYPARLSIRMAIDRFFLSILNRKTREKSTFLSICGNFFATFGRQALFLRFFP